MVEPGEPDTCRPAQTPERLSAPIVVGLDGRDHDADALALASALSRAFGDGMLLVNVLPEGPLGRGMAEFEAISRHEGEELLASASARTAGAVETELINPWPAGLALERVALKRDAGLIVLGSSHHSQLRSIVPGGAGMHLLRSASCPVAVAPIGYAHEQRDIARVGVAYDASSASDQALLVGESVSARLRAPLYVYHAVAGDELGPLERAQMLVLGDSILDRACAQLPSSACPRRRLLSGEPAAAVVAAANEDGIDLLVAGSRGRGRMRESLFGGVCRDLLQSASCAVVLIPHDFRRAAGGRHAVADRPSPAVQ